MNDAVFTVEQEARIREIIDEARRDDWDGAYEAYELMTRRSIDEPSSQEGRRPMAGLLLALLAAASGGAVATAYFAG
ncbi:hypothetical protein [Sphingomonas montanisoli]|uniref:Uncharacterized protein n=1 Tax=Sphingomonas montanisoli TaxID=2606412 RepID=A0A5D9C1I3_9SPHN|nr:hypothetical protein [Sphingomonas montanisoli]TZG25584.1 hypothetical protein FYJ91_11190 [Sphingomonas montanisoli]